MEVNKIAVLGAGIMGAGIAQVAAQGGYQVILRDLRQSLVDRGIQSIERSLKIGINRGTVNPEDKDLILSRITGVTDLAEIRDVDMVIESIVENLSIKKQVFAELDNLCSPRTVIATNTSSLSIAEIASAAKYQDRCIGMHFFYPVPVMRLVEVVKGFDTSPDTVNTVKQVIRRMGKECILVERESPGFVVNRILIPMINEAIWVYAENMASKEDIDTAMKLGAGMPMGPLEYADRLGLDTVYSITMLLYNEFRDPKYRPHPLFSTMIKAERLGRKTGRGFYEYE